MSLNLSASFECVKRTNFSNINGLHFPDQTWNYRGFLLAPRHDTLLIWKLMLLKLSLSLVKWNLHNFVYLAALISLLGDLMKAHVLSFVEYTLWIYNERDFLWMSPWSDAFLLCVYFPSNQHRDSTEVVAFCSHNAAEALLLNINFSTMLQRLLGKCSMFAFQKFNIIARNPHGEPNFRENWIMKYK